MVKANIAVPVFIFVLALLICGQNIWGPSIYILDEAKNATCAREMMESGDHIVPTFNYSLRTDKPPLHYYFMMISYKIFGVNEFAARFFSSVFGALTALITFLYVRKLLNITSAFIASIALISSTHFALQFHLAVPDPYLIFFLTLSGFAFIDGFVNRNPSSVYLAYLSIGLGILAKGPIAIALPGFTIAVFILVSGKFSWKIIQSFRPLSGLFLALMIAAPWYVAVGIKTEGEWLRGFFLDHNLERFAEPQEGHGGAFWLTLVFVVGGMLPFSVYILQSFASWWKGRKNDFLFFCGLFALVVIIFFAVADTKLPNYTVPAYPFFAVLVGNYLSKFLEEKKAYKWFSASSIVVLVMMTLLPLGVIAGLKADANFVFLMNKVPLLLPISGLGLLGLFFLYKGKIKWVLISITIGFLSFTAVALNIFFPEIDKTNPVAKILPQIDTTQPIAYYHRFNSSFAFYLRKPIQALESREEVASFFEKHPEGILITRSDFAGEVASFDFLNQVFEEQDLFETRQTMIFMKK